MWIRALAASALAGLLFVACGGRTDGVGPGPTGTGSSGGSSGGSHGNSSGSSTSSSGGSSGSSSGGTTQCVYVDLSSYDRSCNVASDCQFVTAGDVCDGACPYCGTSLINTGDFARYAQALASLQPGTCEDCSYQPSIECVNHQCTTQEAIDAGVPDSGVCVDVDLSTYDRSCKLDSDCVGITPGTICTGDCTCGGAAINVDGQQRYEQAVDAITPGQCGCPFFGFPRCLAGQCTICGGPSAPACPDGG